MKNHFNSSVFVSGHLYGFDDSTLKCIDPASGTESWKQRGFGKGSLLAADGHLWVLSERGELVLVEAGTGRIPREGARPGARRQDLDDADARRQEALPAQ